MVVQITSSVELAGVIAAQVVTMRSDGAATIYTSVVVDDAVLERRCSAINDAASRISANGAVIHCDGSKTIDDSATRAATRSRTAVSAIPCDGAVVQRHCCTDGLECAANTHPTADTGAACGVGAIPRQSTVFNYHLRTLVVDATAKSRTGGCVAV